MDEARLQLYGSSALIRSLRSGQVQVRIDLGKATEGRNIFPITQENIVLPPGVALNKVFPPTIEVTLDVPVTKEVPLQVDWVGRLPENLLLVNTTLAPETVKVIGGSKILEKVHTLYTAPVKLDNLSKSGSLTAPIVLTPPSLKLVAGSPDKVTVNYQIAERSAGEKK